MLGSMVGHGAQVMVTFLFLTVADTGHDAVRLLRKTQGSVFVLVMYSAAALWPAWFVRACTRLLPYVHALPLCGGQG